MKDIGINDVLWGYLAKGLNVGAGLIVLPLILRYLTEFEVGLWFIFLSSIGLAQLLEFGLQPTAIRNVAYVYAGATELGRNEIPQCRQNYIDYNLLTELIVSLKKIYRIIALLAILILSLLGTIYISYLTEQYPERQRYEYIICWLFFSSGYIINLYYGYVISVLKGRGDVAQANIVIVFNRCVFIIFSSILLIFGFGLISICIVSLLSCIVGRTVANVYFRKDKTLFVYIRSVQISRNLFPTLWHNSSRHGVVQVSAFLIQKSGVLIVSLFVSVEASASYGLVLTLFSTIQSIAVVLCQLQTPKMNYIQANLKDNNLLLNIYSSSLVWGLIFYSVFSVMVLLFGHYLLLVISSSTDLLPIPLMIIIAVMGLLELNHSLAANFLTTLNIVPFVRSAVISGLIIFVGSLLLVQLIGVWGVVLAQFLVQVSYNNWKWPVLAAHKLRLPVFSVYRTGMVELLKMVRRDSGDNDIK